MGGAAQMQVFSDLHLEFQKDGGRGLLERGLEYAPGVQTAVLAGDIGVAGRYRRTLERALSAFSERFEAIFFVPGNHEHYGTRVPEVEEKLRKLAGLFPRVTLLEPGVVGSWAGRRVLGATLWFPRFACGPYEDDRTDLLTDFSAIKGFQHWVYRKNEEHSRWLRDTVQEGDVVITHHLPTWKSIPEQYADDPINVFYVSDMEDLIVARKPALWIHGHTHAACDYRLGATRIVANPRGYPKEDDTGYRTLVVDGSAP